jgi:integrase/recombinase XerD
MSQHVERIETQSLKGKPDIIYDRRVCAVLARGAKNLAEMQETRNEKAAGATAIIDVKTEFAEQLKRDGYSLDTIKQCSYYLNLFEKKGVNILHPEQVKAFIAEQKWQTHSKATAATIYGIFAKYMHLQWTPPRYRYDQKIPFIPTEKEIDDLIAGTGKKTSMLLRLLKETGARLTEALRIKWTDVDLVKGTVTINSPEKNSLPRILKISPTLVSMLNALPKESDYVLNRSRNTVESNYQLQRNRLAKKLQNPRLKQIHLHTFRHFFATMLYAKTINILKVQQALGHKNLTNTQLYTHLVNFDNDEYDVQVAETLEEAKKLGEAGYDYFVEMDGRKLFRKRK